GPTDVGLKTVPVVGKVPIPNVNKAEIANAEGVSKKVYFGNKPPVVVTSTIPSSNGVPGLGEQGAASGAKMNGELKFTEGGSPTAFVEGDRVAHPVTK